jgi:hypothetical protein
MSRESVDSLDGPVTFEPGSIGDHETWWVERQEALERAGYMLRPRYRPHWKPSWTGTNKYHLRCEDGLSQTVSIEIVLSTTCTYAILATVVHGCNTNL